MPIHAFPGTEGAEVTFKDRCENFIGGEWAVPVGGQYFEGTPP